MSEKTHKAIVGVSAYPLAKKISKLVRTLVQPHTKQASTWREVGGKIPGELLTKNRGDK